VGVTCTLLSPLPCVGLICLECIVNKRTVSLQIPSYIQFWWLRQENFLAFVIFNRSFKIIESSLNSFPFFFFLLSCWMGARCGIYKSS
jgi:hypothetical protein